MVVTALSRTGRRLVDPDTEVVEGLQDVGMAAEQSGHQDGQEHHDDTEDDGQSNHE